MGGLIKGRGQAGKQQVGDGRELFFLLFSGGKESKGAHRLKKGECVAGYFKLEKGSI